MRWHVRENVPVLAPSATTGARIFCDDVELHRVVSFDTEEGWALVHCTDGHTGHPGRVHIDPNDENRACQITVRGTIRLEMPS